jgi:hypothetical protein
MPQAAVYLKSFLRVSGDKTRFPMASGFDSRDLTLQNRLQFAQLVIIIRSAHILNGHRLIAG